MTATGVRVAWTPRVFIDRVTVRLDVSDDSFIFKAAERLHSRLNPTPRDWWDFGQTIDASYPNLVPPAMLSGLCEGTVCFREQTPGGS